jgi:hypothetical protein
MFIDFSFSQIQRVWSSTYQNTEMQKQMLWETSLDMERVQSSWTFSGGFTCFNTPAGLVALGFVAFDAAVVFCVSLFPGLGSPAGFGVLDRDFSKLPGCILRPALPSPPGVSMSSCNANSSLHEDTCHSMHSRH